jgi:hypothetical protein
MTTGKYSNRGDIALHSGKIITNEFEVERHNEKHVIKLTNESSLKDYKDGKDGKEDFDVSADEKELDIAIVDDIAITEDDISLKSVTARSIFVGFVNIILKIIIFLQFIY